MKADRRSLERHRVQRRFAVEQYAGPNWLETNVIQSVPVNLLAQYVAVLGQKLIAKNPRVMLSTFDRSNKPAVNAMNQWANKQIEKIRLADTLKRVVLDALFSIGILKVGLATPEDAALYSWNIKAGQPFAERVDLDDFVFDTHARDFSEVTYIGHRYRCPKSVAEAMYGKKAKDLPASTDSFYNAEGDERISAMGRGTMTQQSEEFEDFVDLWEIYLPRHRKVYTFADDVVLGASPVSDGDKIEELNCQDWIGPDTGPYHILGFGWVLGSAMPKGPIQDLIDLHMFANNSYRKLIDQTQRQKTVLCVQGGAMEDGSRTQKANDGDIIRTDNPAAAIEKVFGGANQNTLQMFMQSLQLYNEMAGNLRLMGGIAPESKTATQDKMLNENASAGVADKQDSTITFVAGALKALCWYWWHDPYLTMKVSHPIPGMPEMAIQRQVFPQQRSGSFEDLDIKVDPYSMQHSTPQSKLSTIMQIVKEVWFPMQQQAAQAGVMMDYNALFKLASQLTDTPEILDLLTVQEPPTETTGSSQGGAQPPTERTYNRVSTPGRTDKGNEQNMIAQMAGVDNGGNQDSNGQMQR